LAASAGRNSSSITAAARRPYLQLDEVVEHGWFSAVEIAGLNLPPDMEVMLPAALAWSDSRPATD
jgi:hypothetical protein